MPKRGSFNDMRLATPSIVRSKLRCVHSSPLSQHVMGPQGRKVGSNGRLMLMARADQHAMPLPAAGLRGLDEHEHLSLVEVRSQSAEHPLREEGRAPVEGLEDPLVVERLHAARL